MKPFKYIIFLAVVIALVAQPMTAEPPSAIDTKVKPLMQLKLDRAKNILEGLALEDYDQIASNARALRLLSLESGWNIYQTKEYMDQSRDFRQTTDLIAKAAENKDISRAALGYVTLTVRCVECHQYMRTHKTELMKFQPQ
tara:strand:+ start:127617 stop:128039 length:423 start_codon:yes stop_codon:yes gene_type:complete